MLLQHILYTGNNRGLKTENVTASQGNKRISFNNNADSELISNAILPGKDTVKIKVQKNTFIPDIQIKRGKNTVHPKKQQIITPINVRTSQGRERIDSNNAALTQHSGEVSVATSSSKAIALLHKIFKENISRIVNGFVASHWDDLLNTGLSLRGFANHNGFVAQLG